MGCAAGSEHPSPQSPQQSEALGSVPGAHLSTALRRDAFQWARYGGVPLRRSCRPALVVGVFAP